MKHKVLDFIKEKLVFLPVSGPPLTGQKIGKYLAPFQSEIIREAYKQNGQPKQNIVLCYSRKFGKSMIASWFLNYLLETKKGWRGLVAASTFSQSEHIFQLVAQQIENNPELSGDYKVLKERIVNKTNDSQLSRVYSRASANLGNIGIQTIVMDQIESQQDRSNFDALATGMLMQGHKPHIFILANVPVIPSHWSLPFIENRRKDKETTFFEYAAPLDKPWDTEAAKKAANPFYKLYKNFPQRHKHLKGFVRNLDKKEEEAKQSPEEANSYRRYVLGQKISQRDYQWIRSEDLKVKPLDQVLKWKYRAVLGLDLSLTQDFSAAAVMFFDCDSDKVAVHPILHIADNLSWRATGQQNNFRRWEQAGHLVIQNGKALNPKVFLDDLDDFLMKHKIRPIQYCWDRGLSTAQLTDQYPKSTLYHSTAYQVSAGLRWLEGRAKEGQLFITSDNPCVRWMHDCATASARSKGYSLLTRASNRESIDICQAEILATKWHLENPYKQPLYMWG